MRIRLLRVAGAAWLVTFCPVLNIDAWAASAPKPAEGMQETFPACKWGEVKGRYASIWSFSCGPEGGGVRLVADDSVPGFVLKDDGPDAKAAW